eukprot:29883_5
MHMSCVPTTGSLLRRSSDSERKCSCLCKLCANLRFFPFKPSILFSTASKFQCMSSYPCTSCRS